jgi:class 3 adenylate cyclase
MEHIGIDVHKRETQICILTEGGELIERRVRTLAERFSEVLGPRPRARILLEASTESEWVARCLEGLGHDVIVADPNFAPMYATRTRRVKTDRRDARALTEANVLGAYHAEMGRLILEHEGTLERFTGDGMMVFFNDPVPVVNPAERAIRMAVAMRDRVTHLSAAWRKRGYELALGVGIAQGYATIGAIGFEGRWDYGAIGTVTNLAARLCAEAKGGQILVSPRVVGAVEELIDTEEVGALALRGLLKPVPTFNVARLKGKARESP